ncbi:MAG: hypothetical protein P0Y60_09100 [Candidatus Microbacterium colombiense]|nr:MAG: hypothetical protein P0Y60_09100 [Microbacterium sp.]
MGEPVALHDQEFAGQPVDGLPVDPHLLCDDDTDLAHDPDEPRLQCGVGE